MIRRIIFTAPTCGASKFVKDKGWSPTLPCQTLPSHAAAVMDTACCLEFEKISSPQVLKWHSIKQLSTGFLSMTPILFNHIKEVTP